jgi:hypothetical protein
LVVQLARLTILVSPDRRVEVDARQQYRIAVFALPARRAFRTPSDPADSCARDSIDRKNDARGTGMNIEPVSTVTRTGGSILHVFRALASLRQFASC